MSLNISVTHSQGLSKTRFSKCKKKKNDSQLFPPIQGYRVYFLHDNMTSVQTVRGNKSAMVKTITRLGEWEGK